MSTRASAYIHQGRLCIIGVSEQKHGVVPFAVSLPVQGEVIDGGLDMSGDMSDQLLEALDQARSEIKRTIKKGQIQQGAESLVLRARQGDQNAMAMINGVRKNARQGNKRSLQAMSAIKAFIHKNPTKAQSNFGLDVALSESKTMYQKCAALVTWAPSESPCRVVTLLANSKLNSDVLLNVEKAIEPDMIPAFELGFSMRKKPRHFLLACQKLDTENYEYAKTGYLFGRASVIQSIRRGGPVSHLCPVAGWELGE